MRAAPVTLPVMIFLDERRDVDARRAGGDAGRVEAKEAAGGFDDRLLLVVARGDISQVGRELVGGKFRAQWHLLGCRGEHFRAGEASSSYSILLLLVIVVLDPFDYEQTEHAHE